MNAKLQIIVEGFVFYQQDMEIPDHYAKNGTVTFRLPFERRYVLVQVEFSGEPRPHART